jgi:hypothetical protein
MQCSERGLMPASLTSIDRRTNLTNENERKDMGFKLLVLILGGLIVVAIGIAAVALIRFLIVRSKRNGSQTSPTSVPPRVQGDRS